MSVVKILIVLGLIVIIGIGKETIKKIQDICIDPTAVKTVKSRFSIPIKFPMNQEDVMTIISPIS